MTLIINDVDVKQKLIKEDFNDDCKTLKHLKVFTSTFFKHEVYAFNEDVLHAVVN